MDASGRQKIESRIVNTKTLLECKNRAEAKLLLDNMSSFEERLVKMQNNKKASKKAKKGSPSVAAFVMS
ncbi:hypothetical protein A2U01_0060229, partial [Trifolium medium]|nr:hypothetical protein [Trifolium medium]